MALGRCDYCGNAFNRFGSNVCADCTKELDQIYVKVRKFIYKNPEKANFTMIVENTETSEKALSYLIKQGKINIEAPASGTETRCRSCGAATTSGTLCERCKLKVLSESLRANQPPSGERSETEKKAKSGILPINYTK